MASKNLFTGIEIQFAEQMFDNSEYNARFNRDGFRQHMKPAKESSVQRVEAELIGWMKQYGYRFEREFTNRADGVVTMYISAPKQMSKLFIDFAKGMALLTSVKCGNMKSDAVFVTRGN